MTWPRARGVAAVLLALTVATVAPGVLGATPSATATSVPLVGPAAGGPGVLTSLDMLSSRSVWAVGEYRTPMAAHYDGRRWTRFTLVPREEGHGSLQGVSASGENDVWAVGVVNSSTGDTSLIEHWNGTRWHELPATEVSGDFDFLNAVTAISRTDAWAVGGALSEPLILHWDGTQWTRVAAPGGLHGLTRLTGVTAIAADDVWAVGTSRRRTLSAHWDGDDWSVVKTPNVRGGTGNALGGVSADAADDVWAMGSHFHGLPPGKDGLIEHWDGRRWRIVPSVERKRPLDLFGIAAQAPDDVWAVGTAWKVGGYATFIEHWDGDAWTQVSAPSPGQFPGLVGVATQTSSDAWAVGGDSDSSVLRLHWDGSTWTIA